jgi:RHS repeat-associated protein
MLTTYTYDRANRLTRADAGGVVTTYTVDAAGNRTGESSPTRSIAYTWDAAGRLAAAEPDAGPMAFTYDADGRRVAKQSTDAAVTGYLYDYKRLLHETDDVGGAITRTYASDTSDEFGDLIGEDGEFVHQYDAQADTHALLDTTGAVEARYKYDAFGEVRAVSVAGGPWAAEDWQDLPLDLTTHMLAGGRKQYYLDLETSLYLLGAGQTAGGGRYYDAAAGRFTSEDPVRHQAGDPNLYRYVGNNPVNRLDPGGHDAAADAAAAEAEKQRRDAERKAAENQQKSQASQQNNDKGAQQQQDNKNESEDPQQSENRKANERGSATAPKSANSNPTGSKAPQKPPAQDPKKPNWKVPSSQLDFAKSGDKITNPKDIRQNLRELQNRKDYHYNRIHNLYGEHSDNPKEDQKALDYYDKQIGPWKDRLNEVNGLSTDIPKSQQHWYNWNPMRKIYTGSGWANDEQYSQAKTGGGEAYTENAGHFHKNMEKVASVDPTGLAQATDESITALEGEQLHNEVMANANSPASNTAQKFMDVVGTGTQIAGTAIQVVDAAKQVKNAMKPEGGSPVSPKGEPGEGTPTTKSPANEGKAPATPAASEGTPAPGGKSNSPASGASTASPTPAESVHPEGSAGSSPAQGSKGSATSTSGSGTSVGESGGGGGGSASPSRMDPLADPVATTPTASNKPSAVVTPTKAPTASEPVTGTTLAPAAPAATPTPARAPTPPEPAPKTSAVSSPANEPVGGAPTPPTTPTRAPTTPGSGTGSASAAPGRAAAPETGTIGAEPGPSKQPTSPSRSSKQKPTTEEINRWEGEGGQPVDRGAKRGPKTDSDEAHNAKIRSEADRLEKGGNRIVSGGGREKETLIPTPGGTKEGRRPDIIYETPTGERRGLNVGKTKADGSPVKRETQALQDLNGPGNLPTEFVPYDR